MKRISRSIWGTRLLSTNRTTTSLASTTPEETKILHNTTTSKGSTKSINLFTAINQALHIALDSHPRYVCLLPFHCFLSFFSHLHLLETNGAK